MARNTYPGSLDRRGDTWRWRWSYKKEHHVQTFETKSKSEAIHRVRKEVARIEADYARRQAGAPDLSTVTMKDLLDDFTASHIAKKSDGCKGSYADSIGLFRQYFVEERGNPTVASIRAADISRFIDWRYALRRQGKRKEPPKNPPSQTTLRRDHRVLHTVFQWGIEKRELRPDNPCTKGTRPERGDERQPIILSRTQFETMLAECEHHPMLKLWVLIYVETGPRGNSEALWLRWEDIDFERRRIHISGLYRRTKTGEGRWLPMTDRLYAALKEHFAAFRLGGSPWLFHHTTTRRHHTRGERLKSLLHSFQNAARNAGMPTGLRPYDLRHTAITWLVREVPAGIAQKVAGHASLEMTEHYTHLDDSDLDVVIEVRRAKAAAQGQKTG